MSSNIKNSPAAFTLVLGAILMLLSYYFYAQTIGGFPSHIHAWTQSDKYALSLGFLNNGFNFLLPRTYFYGIKDGITAVDFPLHEYLVAIYMKVSGSQEPIIIRGYTLLCQFVGYYYLYLLSCRLSGSRLHAVVVPVFAFTLPILTYYQICFLPTSTAWATFWVAMYYLVRYHEAQSIKHFYLALGWLAITAMVRTPYNIYLFGVLLWILGLQTTGHLRQHSKQHLKGFALAYIFVALWAVYKYWLLQHYGTIFLSTLMPATSLVEWKQLMYKVWERWHTQFGSIYHVFLFGIAAAGGLLKGRKQRHLFLLSSLFMLGGFFYFSGLMLKQYIDHEYYFIDSLYPGLVCFFTLGWSLVVSPNKYFNSAIVVLATVLLAFAARHSMSIQNLKYSKTTWDRAEYVRGYMEGSDMLLDSLDVAKDAKLLVLDAYSVNMPLIKMKRYGWTMLTTSPKEVQRALQNQFDYIICIDAYLFSDVLYDNPTLANHLQRVGGNGKISVFRYQNEAFPTANAYTLLGISSTVRKDSIYVSDTSIVHTSPRWNITRRVAQAPAPEQKNSIYLPSDAEFGITYSLEVTSSIPRHVLWEGEYCFADAAPALLCDISIQVADSLYYYYSQPIKAKRASEWFSNTQLFILPEQIPEGAKLSCYFWNPNKANVWVQKVRVTLF